MIRTNAIVLDINDVPREWVFEHYLNLQEELNGQDIKIKSPFGSEDRNPSMCIYYTDEYRGYRFKDFSSGKGGDGVSLVQYRFDIPTRWESAQRIIADYNKSLSDKDFNKKREIIKRSKYKVKEYKLRDWSYSDQLYWLRYHIGSKLLDFYNIKPLSSYTLEREDGTDSLFISNRNCIYGFFRSDNSLYKIYQPFVKEAKFIKVQEYIQGTDQLTMSVPFLVGCSSLKDIMAFNLLGFENIECVAPDSENILIPHHIIAAYKLKYRYICTLFDNDEAGLRSMMAYKREYGIPYAHLQMKKDISDSIQDYGISQVKEEVIPLLKKAFNEYR